MTPDEHERFMAFVIVEPNSGCWLWNGAVNRAGYGLFRGRAAHRVLYIHTRGPITGGLLCCHRCDVPGCVNPDHIFLGTHAENQRDSAVKGRRGPLVKLTAAKARQMLALSMWGFRARELGERFGVHPATAHGVLKGDTWRHVYEGREVRAHA